MMERHLYLHAKNENGHKEQGSVLADCALPKHGGEKLG